MGVFDDGPLLKNFRAMAKTQFNKQVQVVCSDNGQEFLCLQDYFSQMGILHQTSCIDTPQQNGHVERKHQHALNVAHALRFQAHLPIDFWGECVLSACHLINLISTPLLHGKTPYELLFGCVPICPL